MNDYLDITASELLRELDHFFLIDTHDGAQTGFYYKVEILRSLQPSHQYAPHDYKITRLAVGENDSNVVLLDYDGVHKKIQSFRRGEWVNRLNKYFYQKERHYLQQLADHPNFQLIQY